MRIRRRSGGGCAAPHPLLDQVVKVRGERARWFGAGEDDVHVNSDFAYRHLGLWEDAPQRWAGQPELVQDVVVGYVAGFNAAVADGGVDGWCEGEPWVGPITTQDLYAYVSDLVLLASSRAFIDEIGSTQTTGGDAAPGSVPASTAEPVGLDGLDALRAAFGASNAWAFGAEASAAGRGMLLANPHFPWEGELRFWESHLLIPGEVNVYGATLTGLPGVQIGFNDDIAWSHTVSSGHRFTLYRYDLDPADPTVYLVDGARATDDVRGDHDRGRRQRRWDSSVMSIADTVATSVGWNSSGRQSPELKASRPRR